MWRRLPASPLGADPTSSAGTLTASHYSPLPSVEALMELLQGALNRFMTERNSAGCRFSWIAFLSGKKSFGRLTQNGLQGDPGGRKKAGSPKSLPEGSREDSLGHRSRPYHIKRAFNGGILQC